MIIKEVDKKSIVLVVGVVLAAAGVTNTFNQTFVSVMLIIFGVVLITRSLL